MCVCDVYACMYVFMYVDVCVFRHTCTCVGANVDAWGWPRVSSLIALHLIYWGSLSGARWSFTASLATQLTSSVPCLCCSSPGTTGGCMNTQPLSGFYMGCLTRLLMLAQRALSTKSHPHSPASCVLLLFHDTRAQEGFWELPWELTTTPDMVCIC